MDPSKEANYILQRFIQEWIAYYNVDGWVFSVTWDRDDIGAAGGWRLTAAHRAPFDTMNPIRVHATIDRDEWIDQYQDVVDKRVEEMYHASFRPENRVIDLADTDTMVVVSRGC